MSENKKNLLGVWVSNLNFNQVLEKIQKWWENGPQIYQIFTPNPEILVLCQKDKKLAKILNGADLALPDGQGLIWASRFLGKPLPERIAGVDLMEKLVGEASRRDLAVGLIGGGPKIAVKAGECLKIKYPRLKIWAEEGPEVEIANYELRIANNYDLEGLAKRIGERGTSLLFVGLGCPKQEYFINNLKKENSKVYNLRSRVLVMMGVGGGFDYISGKVPRAPQWVRDLGLEWLFRLLVQPWRLKRQLALLKFIYLVLKGRILGRG